MHLKDVYTRALPFYSLQKECFLSGIARITSPPQPPHPHTPHPPTFFKRENSHSYIFHGSPFNGRGKAHKKGRISKNVGWWEGDINIQPKKQFRVQNICLCEEIDQKYIWCRTKTICLVRLSALTFDQTFQSVAKLWEAAVKLLPSSQLHPS